MNAKIICLFQKKKLFEFEFYILISSRHTWISWPLAFLLKGGKESHVDEVSMRYCQFQSNKISTFRFDFVFFFKMSLNIISAFFACFHFEKFYMYFFIKISAYSSFSIAYKKVSKNLLLWLLFKLLTKKSARIYYFEFFLSCSPKSQQESTTASSF